MLQRMSCRCDEPSNSQVFSSSAFLFEHRLVLPSVSVCLSSQQSLPSIFSLAMNRLTVCIFCHFFVRYRFFYETNAGSFSCICLLAASVSSQAEKAVLLLLPRQPSPLPTIYYSRAQLFILLAIEEMLLLILNVYVLRVSLACLFYSFLFFFGFRFFKLILYNLWGVY